MIVNDPFATMLAAPVRTIVARVELYNGSTLSRIFKHTDALKSFSVERVGEASKFFGFGVCQRLNVKLIDPGEEIDVTTANTLEVEFGVGADYIYPYPAFRVTEVNRDQNTGELSITAYDAINEAVAHTVSEVGFTSYTIREFAARCAAILGLPLSVDSTAEGDVWGTYYDGGANFDGTESLRDALNAVAEATQTIYYINSEWELTFKRLTAGAGAALSITRDKYLTLDSKTNRRLTAVCHATELGDNVEAATGESGTTQYVRDNPFWELREDIGAIVDNALAAVGGLTINQFNCKWRGDFLLEIGDQITLTTKDGGTVHSYVLNDVVNYDGTLSEQTQWSYTDSEGETASNPSTLGEALRRTFARVDKANQQIELLASSSEENAEAISRLEIETGGISASVQKVESGTSAALDGLNSDVAALMSKVEAQITPQDVQISITTELEKGVDKVITATGFTFDDTGLTVSKTGSEMTTTITEDGMVVYRDSTAVLTANNVGVDAVNLHATTYLVVGSNSRFEDYGAGRTGCFWIGN